MNQSEYDAMYRLEDSHWWFVARRDLLCRSLDKRLPDLRHDRTSAPLRLLDVGCGTGGTLDRLRAYGEVVGLDLEPTALQFCRARGWNTLVRASATALPFADGTFDVVVALDVLEHIPDHEAASREIARVLAPGGLLFLTVPAYPSLWSGHDVALMHQRRYLSAELRTVLHQSGLRIERLTHTVSTLLPLVWTIRRTQKLLRPHAPPHADAVPTSPLLNTLLLHLLKGENRLTVRVSHVPFGLTLFAVARKEANGQV